MTKVYRMTTLHKHQHLFKEDVDKLIKQRQFKKACEVANALEVHQEYGLEEFIIPLIVEEKAVVTEEFLTASPKHAQDVIRFLDGLVCDNTMK